MKPSKVQHPVGKDFNFWWPLKAWGTENDSVQLVCSSKDGIKEIIEKGNRTSVNPWGISGLCGLPPCSADQRRKSWIKNAQAWVWNSTSKKAFFFCETEYENMRWEDILGRKKWQSKERRRRGNKVKQTERGVIDWGWENVGKMPGCLLLVVSGLPPVTAGMDVVVWLEVANIFPLASGLHHKSSYLKISHQLDISFLDACSMEVISSPSFVEYDKHTKRDTHTHTKTVSLPPCPRELALHCRLLTERL